MPGVAFVARRRRCINNEGQADLLWTLKKLNFCHKMRKQTPYLYCPLDTDLYKPTVHQILLHRFANVSARYEFTCRNAAEIGFDDAMPLDELRGALNAIGAMQLTGEDERWLDSQDYFRTSYRRFWESFRLMPERDLSVTKTEGRVCIAAAGPVIAIQPLEVYILSTVNGLWTRLYAASHGGLEGFLQDFTFELAKGYDGVRHDSGDPKEFGDTMIAHYEGFRLDPRQKRIVFSDGLTIEAAIDLHRYFAGRIQISFGIGTHLTHDLGMPVPSIVMKMVESHGQPVTKLSNEPGKASCGDSHYIAYVRHAVEHYGPRSVRS